MTSTATKFPNNFSVAFQETIIYCILTDVKFAHEIVDIIEHHYFANIYLSELIRLVFEFKNKYNMTPSVDVLRDFIQKKKKQEKQLVDGMFDILHRIFDEETYKGGSAYVKENTINFCRVQKLKQALLKAHDISKQDNPDFDVIKQVVMTGLHNSQQKKLTNYKVGFRNRIEAVTETVPRIKTGLTEIDSDVLIGGGMPIKKYGIIMTFTSGGKTHMMVQLGAAAMRDGKTVLHLSLEDDEIDVALRYDSNLSGIPSRDFLYDTDKQRYVEERLGRVPGKLFIKEYPSRTASVQTIRAHIEKMADDGIKPDLVLVDYISEIKPVDKRERRHELAEISRDLKGVAGEYEVALWTAAQAQRYAMRQKVVKLEQIGEAFEMAHPCDFMLTIGQNPLDNQNGVCRLCVAKNKLGPDLQVYMANFPKDLSRFYITEKVDVAVLNAESVGFNMGSPDNN